MESFPVSISLFNNTLLNFSTIGVTTAELDNLTAETCAYMNMVHPGYSKLAARIAISNLHKKTTSDFLEVATRLRNFKDKMGRDAPMLADDVYDIIVRN